MRGSVDDYFPATSWGVDVRFEPVPEQLSEVTRTGMQFEANADQVLVDMLEHGRMLLMRDAVVLDVAPDLRAEDINFYLYGWAPRIIRILREEYSLHGSAVQTPHGAIAVMGQSMAGKSTTTLGLVRRGYPLIVDDVLPVDVEEDRVVAHGWERPLHLRTESARYFGVDDARTHEVSHKLLTDQGGSAERTPLLLMVELVADPEADVVTAELLSGAPKLAVVINHSDVANLAAADGRQPSFFRWAGALAARVPVVRLVRPTHGWHLDEVLVAIEAQAERAVPAGT